MVKRDSLAIHPAQDSRSRASASLRARREVAYRSLRPYSGWQSLLTPLLPATHRRFLCTNSLHRFLGRHGKQHATDIKPCSVTGRERSQRSTES